MTTKIAVVRARVIPNIKLGAQKVLCKLGLSISDAINLLLIQADMKKVLYSCEPGYTNDLEFGF